MPQERHKSKSEIIGAKDYKVTSSYFVRLFKCISVRNYISNPFFTIIFVFV
jgi:hypothetical protein